MNREAARKQREAEWEEVERRRAWEEEEMERERALRCARHEAAVRKAEIEGRQRRLEDQQRVLVQQEAAAKQAEAAAAKAEAKGETARRAANEEAATLRAKAVEQRQRLAVEKARGEADAEKRKGELKQQQAKAEEALKRLEQHKQAHPLTARARSRHPPTHAPLLLSPALSLHLSGTLMFVPAFYAACKRAARRVDPHSRPGLRAPADPPRPRRLGRPCWVLEDAASRLAWQRA